MKFFLELYEYQVAQRTQSEGRWEGKEADTHWRWGQERWQHSGVASNTLHCLPGSEPLFFTPGDYSLMWKKSQWVLSWFLGSYAGDIAFLWWNHLKQQDEMRLIQPEKKPHILVEKVVKYLQKLSTNVMGSLSLGFQNLWLKKILCARIARWHSVAGVMTVMTPVPYGLRNYELVLFQAKEDLHPLYLCRYWDRVQNFLVRREEQETVSSRCTETQRPFSVYVFLLLQPSWLSWTPLL